MMREFPGEVDSIISNLLPGNLEWFAQLFVSLLARTALDNETDEDVLGDSTLAKADPNRIQKLHQRLSSKPRVNAMRSQEKAPISDGSNFEARTFAQPPTAHRTAFMNQHRGPTSPQLPRPELGQPSEAFSGVTESFFFQFLQLTRSVQFARHVEGLLVVQISETTAAWFKTADAQSSAPLSPVAFDSPASPRAVSPTAFIVNEKEGARGTTRASHALDNDEIVDRLVELKLLARFLGFLTFRAHWPLSLMASTHTTSDSKSSVAVDAGIKEAIFTEERLSNPPPLKVHHFLREATEKGQLVLVIPWLVDFLKMMRYVHVQKSQTSI